MPPKKPRPKLTVAQTEIVGQFNDYSFENAKLTFEQTAKKVKIKFASTPQGRLFKRECKAMFDLERK
jgi:hypothetical protein